MTSIYGVNFDAVALEKTQKILKKVYETKGKFLELAKKESDKIDGGGRYARIPLHVAGNENNGTRRADMTGNARMLPDYGEGQQFAEGQVGITNYYHTLSLDRAKVDASKGNENSIINMISFEMDNGMTDAIKQINKILNRDGSGFVAEIITDDNSATQSVRMCGAVLKNGGTATTAADYFNGVSASHLRVGKRYQIIEWDNGTGKFNYVAPTVNADTYITLSSVDVSSKQIILSSAVDTTKVANRYFLAEFGNVYCTNATNYVSNDPIGILSLVNSGNISVFGIANALDNVYPVNINAATASYWNSKKDTSTSLRDFDEFTLMSLLLQMEAEGLSSFDNFRLYCTPTTLLKCAKILSTNEQKIYTEALKGGYKITKFAGLNQDVGFIDDIDAAENTIRGFSFDNLILPTIFDSILTWDNQSGRIWDTGKINRKDVIMAVIYARFNLAINVRNHSFVYESLDPALV